MNALRMKQFMSDLQEHLGQVDELTLVVLKGHLLIEESINRVISRFVFHPEMLESARLSFAHRVSIARAISLDEHDNSMWDMILAINALRNNLAHNLHSPKRAQQIQRVLLLLKHETRDAETTSFHSIAEPEHLQLLDAIAFCTGFLSSFEAEVERFRDWIDNLDQVVNPHRHKDSQQQD